MFYTRAHIQALEAQISRLEQSHVSEISRLEQLLAEERNERRELLNRLLEKRNIEPIAAKPEPKLPDTVQSVTPFGNGGTPEVVGLMKESWLGEEAAYLMEEHGMTEEQAKSAAERNWVAENRAD